MEGREPNPAPPRSLSAQYSYLLWVCIFSTSETYLAFRLSDPFHSGYGSADRPNRYSEDHGTLRLALAAGEQFPQPGKGFLIKLPRPAPLRSPGPNLGLAICLRSCESPHTGHLSDGHRLFAHAPKPTPEKACLSSHKLQATSVV